jgi:hypothetical protein
VDAHIRVSGSWKKLNGLHVNISGTWKEVQAAYVKVSGVWKQFYLFFTASADKASVSGSNSGSSPCGNPGNTDIVTVTAQGGTAPYTYAWSRVGAAADSGPYQANAPTSNATSFSDVDSSVCDADLDSTEQWCCTITDSDSNVVTVDVNVTLLWTDLS